PYGSGGSGWASSHSCCPSASPSAPSRFCRASTAPRRSCSSTVSRCPRRSSARPSPVDWRRGCRRSARKCSAGPVSTGSSRAGTAEFLKAQLAEVKAKLDTQEKEVSQFKKRNLVDLPQQAAVNLGMIERLDTQLRANVDSQTRLAERRELLAKRAAQASEYIP